MADGDVRAIHRSLGTRVVVDLACGRACRTLQLTITRAGALPEPTLANSSSRPGTGSALGVALWSFQRPGNFTAVAPLRIPSLAAPICSLATSWRRTG